MKKKSNVIQVVAKEAVRNLGLLIAWRDKYFPFRCSDPAIRIVHYLAMCEGCVAQQKVIYMSMPYTVPTTRQWLRALEKVGLVKISQSDKDRRIFLVELTKRGYQAIDDFSSGRTV